MLPTSSSSPASLSASAAAPRRKPPRELPLLLAVALMIAVLAAKLPAFRAPNNLTVVAQNAAYIGILACGEALVIFTGGLDLSVGALLAIAVCAGAATLAAGLAWPLAVGAALLAGFAGGAFNGFLVTRRGLPPILTTLATAFLFRYGVSILTHARYYHDFPPAFQQIGAGWNPALLFLLIALVFGGLTLATRLGRWMLAIGGSEPSARLSGIGVKSVVTWAYALSGLCAGCAGVIVMAFNNNAQSTTGQGYELDILAACVVGGVRITGGDGSIAGACLGAILIALLRDGLILTGRPVEQYGLFTGLVIVGAALIATRQRKPK